MHPNWFLKSLDLWKSNQCWSPVPCENSACVITTKICMNELQAVYHHHLHHCHHPPHEGVLWFTAVVKSLSGFKIFNRLKHIDVNLLLELVSLFCWSS